MTIKFWIDQLSTLVSLVAAILSLRAFLFQGAIYIRLFTILTIIEEIAGLMIMFFAVPLNVIAIANNIVILSELWVMTFIFFKIIRSKLYHLFLVGVLIYCNSYLLKHILSRGITSVFPDLSHIIFLVILAIGCFVFYMENLKSKSTDNSVFNFDFWMVTSTCFYATTFVLFQLGLHYLEQFQNKNLDLFFEIFSNTCFIVANLFLCKAFLSLRNQKP